MMDLIAELVEIAGIGLLLWRTHPAKKKVAPDAPAPPRLSKEGREKIRRRLAEKELRKLP